MQRNDKIIIEDAFDGSCSIQMMTYDTRKIFKILDIANRTNFEKKMYDLCIVQNYRGFRIIRILNVVQPETKQQILM